MSRTRIAVFASGRGSNFDAIQAACAAGKLEAEIVALVCDHPGAPVIEKARGKGIKTVVCAVDKSLPAGKRRQAHEAAIDRELEPLNPEFAVLAGYMRVLTPGFIENHRTSAGHSGIVNIHPSLLPAFPGLAGYSQAYEHGCKTTGVTVHLVENELDGGPICAQEAFDISSCKSAEEVERLGLAIENRLYPETLKWLLAGKFKTTRNKSGRVCVSQN